MKKILLLCLLVISSITQAQNQIITRPLQLNSVSKDTIGDSLTKILVRGTDRVIKNLSGGEIPVDISPQPLNYSITDTKLGTHLRGIDNALGNFVQTTAGQTSRIWFTGDIATVGGNPYYLSNPTGKGSVPEVLQTVSNADNTKTYFTQDIISNAFPAPTTFAAGTYAGQLSVRVSDESAQERYTIEIYKTDNTGTPINSGVTGSTVGSLGVTVIAILDSGIIDLAQNATTNIGVSGTLGDVFSINTGERVRYHVSAEKVGTAGGSFTFTVYYGNNHSSYYDVPVTPRASEVINDSSVLGANVADALTNLNDLKENLSNKATDFTTVNNTLYPTVQATKTQLDLKAPINNPTFTGTVSGITKTMVDLGNVDNTSDLNKPISTATQTALDSKQNNLGYTPENIANKGIADGYASLGADGKVPNSQIPALAISETFPVNSQAAMLALSGAEQGDVAVRTDISKSFILTTSPASTLVNWQELLTPTDAVQSVNGQNGNVSLTTTHIPEGTNLYYTEGRVSTNTDVTANTAARHSAVSIGTANGLSLSGPQQLSLVLASTSNNGALSSTDWNTFNNKQPALVSGTNIKTIESQSLVGSGNVDLSKSDVGLANVDNTSDLAKPISTATQTALNLKENSFSKNTAFNKNFGTTAGTVAQGNDSRILNGQTAFSWGNHSGLYPLYNGTGATGTWGINITGVSEKSNTLEIQTTNVSDANADRGIGARVFSNTFGYINYPNTAGVNFEVRRASGSASALGTFQLNSGNDAFETLKFRKVNEYSGGDLWSSWRTLWHDGDFSQTNINNWNTAFGWGNHATFGYQLASGYTAADVLSKLLTVDGTGSGLDSDYLDGQHGSFYLNWNNFTNKPTTFTPSAHTLDSHSNVSITSNTSGEILKWNGTNWVNNTLAEASIEPAFSKNTAFNKNFGNSSGTVAEGNDSRILNGQTAFSWGNHNGLYAPLSGGTNYIQNQNASPQTANMWINGKGSFGSTTTGGQLNVKESGSTFEVNTNNFGTLLLSIDRDLGQYRDFIFRGRDFIFKPFDVERAKIDSNGAATFASTVTASNGTLIGGTLTNGYLPKATGANSLGNSLIYDNGTNVGINGSLTANSIIKSGGTSSQFLKANGSVDSNTYLTTSNASSTYLPLSGGTLTGALTGTTITGSSIIKSGGTSAQLLAANGSVVTAGTGVTISGGTISANPAPYKVYTALVSQSGTSAPTATVLDNTLGGTIVWTREFAGSYIGTLSGAFTANKTFFMSSAGTAIFLTKGTRVDNNSVRISSYQFASTASDGGLADCSIEIRVYN